MASERTVKGPMTTSLLDSIQADQRLLLDLVDRLRRTGLSSTLPLPQIAVCGDQSSGKSSVLEGLTGISFPRKENLCTRFATEIIMRWGADNSVSCKINPDSARGEEEKAQLREFSSSINDFEQLPSVIDEATAAMGLGRNSSFSRDVLSIEICGPRRPQLTLVDLPGLIHSSNKDQTEDDIELINSLVENYISQQRTIILAVISAKNDYANQIILKKCRSFDPKGARTLGIITKPDFLISGSENERLWLDLAQNRNISLELGWHLVRNRADDEHHFSTAGRNQKERSFFTIGSYEPLPDHMKGVESLCKRLSNLLIRHLSRELPVLKDELDNLAKATQVELDAMGKSRISKTDQRVFLAELFSSANDIVKMAMNGNYDDEFFGRVDVKAPIGGKKTHVG